MTKRCTECGEVKDIEEFPTRRESNRKRGYCKECDKKHCAQYYQTHKGVCKQKHKEWADNHKEKMRSYSLKNYYRNRDKKLAYGKIYNHKNAVRDKARKKIYAANNIIVINGIRLWKNTCSPNLMSSIETLIMLRNKKNLYRRIRDAE